MFIQSKSFRKVVFETHNIVTMRYCESSQDTNHFQSSFKIPFTMCVTYVMILFLNISEHFLSFYFTDTSTGTIPCLLCDLLAHSQSSYWNFWTNLQFLRFLFIISNFKPCYAITLTTLFAITMQHSNTWLSVTGIFSMISFLLWHVFFSLSL